MSGTRDGDQDHTRRRIRSSAAPCRGDGPAADEGSADGRITLLLRRAQSGDDAAEEALFRAVYDELHGQARRKMARQRRGHTLQTGDLVQEAFLKLARRDAPWEGRTHFFATAAIAMEQVLIDHAKARGRDKRDPGGARLPVEAAEALLVAFEERAIDILALHEALDELATFDPQAAQIVRLKFFGGLTAAEIAEVVETSKRTVERDWEVARAWLRTRLGE